MEQLDWFFGVSGQERHLTYAKEADPHSPDCAADIDINEKYQRICMTIYPCFWGSHPDKQRAYLVHEYTHYFIQPVQSMALDLVEGRHATKEDVQGATEKTTSAVAICIDALLSGHRRYMLKAYKEYLPKTTKKTNAKNTRKIKK